MLGTFTFVLHTHLPYVLGHGKWPHGSDWLCEAVAECYIPILKELDRLAEARVPARISMDFTPVLLEQLADERFPDVFIDYCNERIDLAEQDYEHFFQTKELELRPLALMWHTFYSECKRSFEHTFKRNIVAAFRKHVEAGTLDAMTSGATHGYFPLLLHDEHIRAQIKIGIDTHERHFGIKPTGIWLPECGYRPRYNWHPPVGPADVQKVYRERAGVEEILAECGLEYFVVEGTLTKGGIPMTAHYQIFESYLDELHSSNEWVKMQMQFEEHGDRSLADIYGVKSTMRGLPGKTPVVFSRDRRTSEQVWSGRIGYPGDPAYLEFHKKHHNSGLRYWRVTGQKTGLGEKKIYDEAAATSKTLQHAEHFVALVKETLREHKSKTGRNGIVCSPFDTELFGHWWFEGPQFLGKVFERLHADRDVALTNCAHYLADHQPRQTIALPEGSWGDGGGHYVWMNRDVAWTWDDIYPLEERFRKLVQKIDPENANTFLRNVMTQAARELLLVESSDWQFIITTKGAIDYSTKRFDEHAANLRLLLELADRLLEGGEPDAEDEQLLAQINTANPLFGELKIEYWL